MSKELFENTDVTEGSILLPRFLYYFNADKDKSISPVAKFDPVAALSGSAWQNSTSPSKSPNKKTLVIHQDSFGSNLTLGEKIALIARLKNAGFDIYIKNSAHSFVKIQDNTDYIGLLIAPSKFETLDYKLLAEQNVARDKVVLLTKSQTSQIIASLEKTPSGESYYKGDGFKRELKLITKVPDGINYNEAYNLFEYCSKEVADLLVRNIPTDISANQLTDWIHTLKGASYKDEIPQLINDHKAKIKKVDQLAHIIDALKGTNCKDEIPQLLNDHKAKINKVDQLAKVIYALKEASFEKAIPQLLNDHKDKIESGSQLAKVIYALKGTNSKDEILILFDEHKAKISDVDQLAKVIDALRETGCETEIDKLFDEHKGRISNGFELASVINAIKGTSCKDKIPQLLNDNKDKIESVSQLVEVIYILKRASFEEKIPQLFKDPKAKISDVDQLVNVIDALRETGCETEINKLFDEHKGRISNGFELAKVINTIKETSCKDKIPQLLNDHKDKIESGSHLAKVIYALKKASFEKAIPQLLNDNKDKIESGSQLVEVIYACKRASFEEKIPQLLNDHKDKIESGFQLAEVINSIKETSFEKAIPQLFKGRKVKICDGSALSNVIDALKRTGFEEKIPQLFDEHKGKISNGFELAEVIDAIKETSCKDEIPQLFNDHKGKISNGCQLSNVINAIKETSCKEKIPQLLNDYKDKIYNDYDLTRVIQALDSAEYSWLSEELIQEKTHLFSTYYVRNLPPRIQKIFIAQDPLALSPNTKSQKSPDYVNCEPTFLHIARLESKEQVEAMLAQKEELTNIVAVEIIFVDKLRLVETKELIKELLEALPNLKHLSLPENMREEDLKEFNIPSIEYHDYSKYVIKPKEQKAALPAHQGPRVGGIGTGSNAARPIAKKKTQIYVCPSGVSKSINTESKNSSFDMFPAGEVLNKDIATPEIRNKIIRYNDITKDLTQSEYVPTSFTAVEYTPLTEHVIAQYKSINSSSGTYYRFNQEIKAGKRYRLLSAAASEELVGVLASNGAKITLERGDDDFFYATNTSDKDCTISHVTKVPSKREGEKEFDDFTKKHPNDKISKTIKNYEPRIGNGADEVPDYKTLGHTKWLEKLFATGAGRCELKVAAVMHELMKNGVNKDDIRVVHINGNHVKIEMKYEGHWFFVKDLGGTQPQLNIIETGKYAAKESVSSSKQTPVVQKPGLAPEAALPPQKPTPKLAEYLAKHADHSAKPKVTEQAEFIARTTDSSKKKILVVTKELNQHANALLAQAAIAGRRVYYIDSPAKINLDRKSVAIEKSDSVQIHDDGTFADFIKATETVQKPLLLINWEAFDAKQKVKLNTIIDPQVTVNGRKLAANIQIIGLCNEKPMDDSFLTRHDEYLEANVGFSKQVNISNNSAPEIIDLQGRADWRETLFGPVILKNNRMEWNQSKFAQELLAGKITSFALLNLSPEASQQFEYEYNQAKASGKFSYNGFDIKLPKDLAIKYDQKSFDFDKFKDYSLVSNITSDQAPEDARLINSYLFDQILQDKQVKDGVYSEIPGLISGDSNPVKLYITSALTESQWYLIFSQALKLKIGLELYAAPGIEIPKPLKLSEKVSDSKAEIEGAKQLPQLYVTNNPTEVAKSLKSDAYAIIDVEDYTYQDLIGGIDFKIGKDAFSDFKQIDSQLIEALKKGKIILKGEFSPQLLQLLHPLINAENPFVELAKNLILIIEDKSIKSDKVASYKPLSWLPNAAYTVKYHDVAAVGKAPKIYKETLDLSVELGNSAEESNDFITARKSQFLSMLQDSSMLELIGHSGVGKSRLLKMFEEEKEGHVKVYRELAQFDEWANKALDKDKTKILFIDESNIEDLHFTMFAPLKPGGNRRILYKGQFHEIDENCKIAFARNPKEYGGGRVEQKLFEDSDIPQMHMEDFPACYIYEEILKKSIYDKLDQEVKDKVSEETFKTHSMELIKKYYSQKGKETVRELQEYALVFIYDSYENAINKDQISQVSSKNFIETTATQASIVLVQKSIDIRQKQRQKLFPNETIGINGVLLEGDPGIGKTEMISAILAAKGVLDAASVADEEKSGDKQLYYKIDASLALEKKKAIIINAFENGHIIWIDELNSCIDDGLEKILNAVLTGSHPITGKRSEKPGFMMLATMNQISMEGRSAISPALLHRLTLNKLKPLKEYSIEDLSKIIQHWLNTSAVIENKPENIADIANNLAVEVKALLQDPANNGLNLRNLRKQIEGFINENPDLTYPNIAPAQPLMGPTPTVTSPEEIQPLPDLPPVTPPIAPPNKKATSVINPAPFLGSNRAIMAGSAATTIGVLTLIVGAILLATPFAAIGIGLLAGGAALAFVGVAAIVGGKVKNHNASTQMSLENNAAQTNQAPVPAKEKTSFVDRIKQVVSGERAL